MTRTYDRDGKHYDFALLTHLVEIGEATFYDGPSIYVIKTEDGTVAVRPHQVIFTSTPAPFTLTQVEEIAAFTPSDQTDVPARRSSSWVSADEEDEILKHFGI